MLFLCFDLFSIHQEFLKCLTALLSSLAVFNTDNNRKSFLSTTFYYFGSIRDCHSLHAPECYTNFWLEKLYLYLYIHIFIWISHPHKSELQIPV